MAPSEERTGADPATDPAEGRKPVWGMWPAWKVAEALLFLVAAVATAALLFAGPVLVRDPDELYHFRHAALYAQRGLLFSEFPWTAFSIIGTANADLWYGFHLFLLPFTLGTDPVEGMRYAGIAILASSLTLTYLALARAGIAYPFVWPFLVLFAAPPAVLRMVMLRPHVLSLGLFAWLLVTLMRGPTWGVFLAAFAAAFLHLNLVWIVLLSTGVALLAHWLLERKWAWRAAAAALAGAAGGWLLRPNPLSAAKLLRVQLVQWAIEKQQGTPLLLGGEALPVDPAGLVLQFLPFLGLWCGAITLLVVVLLRKREIYRALPAPQRAFLWTSAVLSVVFFEMTVLVSLRASDQWKLFAVLFVAAVFTAFLRPVAPGGSMALAPRLRRIITGVGLVLSFILAGRVLAPGEERWLAQGYSPDRLRGAAEWLRYQSQPGEIVFHAQWQVFPELFFWNQQNRYINGMDPIFLFAADARRYWKAHHLATGQGSAFTCAAPECPDEIVEDTYQVLRRDFQATYLLVDRRKSPYLAAWAERDRRLERGFASGEVAIYRLVGAPTAAPSDSETGARD